MANLLVGDTVRVKVVFREWSAIGEGDPVDPDTVTVQVLDEDKQPTGLELDPEGFGDTPTGEFYVDWTPEEEGTFYVQFIGDFPDGSTSIVSEKFIVSTTYGVSDEPIIRLGEDQELLFMTEVEPLYVDPEELVIIYDESSLYEAALFIHRYSTEVKKIFKGKEPSFVALEYIKASALCSLAKIYDYGVGGDESSVSLGDLSVTSRTYPRLRITRANAVNWCELAGALRDEMLRGTGRSKAVIPGSKWENPMPQRHLRHADRTRGRR